MFKSSPKTGGPLRDDKGTAEWKTALRKQGSEKKGSFCLQQVQSLKDSAAYPPPNFPQVRHPRSILVPVSLHR